MAYTLYSDQSNIFEAKIKLSGASLNNSVCRVVVETNQLSYLFNGNIDNKGNVSVPINKLKGIIPEGTVGNMKLEVIAEDTYFKPWESEFLLEANKSVTVEVKDPNKNIKKPTAVIELTDAPKKQVNLNEDTNKVYLKTFVKALMKEGITIKKVTKNKQKISEMSNDLIFKHNISEDTRKWILESTLKVLAKKNK